MNEVEKRHRTEFSDFVQERARPGYKKIIGRLNRLWEQWNAEFFGGEMVVPYILLAEPTYPGALGQYSTIGSNGAPAEIRIRPSLVWGTHPLINPGKHFEAGRFLFVADVLLHEMIHQWQHEVEREIEQSQAGHGPIFRDKCNEIGAILGLSPVRSAKKRGQDAKLPSCSQWPHNVREGNFYRGAVKERQGLTPIGLLCRAAREFAESPGNSELLTMLAQAAIMYAQKDKPLPSE